MQSDEKYAIGVVAASGIAFVVTWGACIAGLGMWGFLLGWIPAYLLAGLAAMLWPILLGAIGLCVLAFVAILGVLWAIDRGVFAAIGDFIDASVAILPLQVQNGLSFIGYLTGIALIIWLMIKERRA